MFNPSVNPSSCCFCPLVHLTSTRYTGHVVGGASRPCLVSPAHVFKPANQNRELDPTLIFLIGSSTSSIKKVNVITLFWIV